MSLAHVVHKYDSSRSVLRRAPKVTLQGLTPDPPLEGRIELLRVPSVLFADEERLEVSTKGEGRATVLSSELTRLTLQL